MSCDACGWIAAAASMLAFGSFGVPIKATDAASVDPLVFQSYKSFMCFVTSWLVLAFGESFEFTPWGIVSALFWVPGGVATVYAIQAAGLAIGIGIGSSFIVLVSFFWGIFVFQEHVHSIVGACFAVFCLILGLLGMSYYSSPVQNDAVYDGLAVDEDDGVVQQADEALLESTSVQEGEENETSTVRSCHSTNDNQEEPIDNIPSPTASDSRDDGTSTADDPDGILLQTPDQTTTILGCKIKRRHLGMMAAAFCGIWGGSIMAPMKWCKSDTKGTHYLLSFSIGAAIVTVALWLLRYIANVVHYRGDCVIAYQALPSFRIRLLWKAGGLAGLLWSIGNYFSLISVFYLGEGVGYPLVQSSILVSGLWGIFYFGEVKGRDRITMWLLSSLFTVFGILLLSYEHHEK